jgi:transcriptional regulator with XRE-family HTH domain
MIDPSVRSLHLKLLGAQLRESRLSARKGLRETARLIGVSPTTLGSYEAGRKSISLPELELFCLHLQVPIQRFWTRDRIGRGALARWNRLSSWREARTIRLLRAQRQWRAGPSGSSPIGSAFLPAASRPMSAANGAFPWSTWSSGRGRWAHGREYLDESGPLADRDSAERVGRAVTGFPPDMRGS